MNKPLREKNVNGVAASYVNALGVAYFAHTKKTKLGKQKYFASRKSEGAVEQLPIELVFAESINGVVTIQRPQPLIISISDFDFVKQKLAKERHLKSYRAEAKGKEILVFEPSLAGYYGAAPDYSFDFVPDVYKSTVRAGSPKYKPVLRFTYDKQDEQYFAKRRCYRGEEHWLGLGAGTLEDLLNLLLHHLGKESFFELF